MKYLKKYNEDLDFINSKDQTTWGSTQSVEPKKYGPIDHDYMNLIFIDFLEDGATSESEEEYLYDIIIDLEKIQLGRGVENLIEYSKNLKEFALDLKSCIDKVKDEYPDIYIDSYKTHAGDYIVRFINDDKNNSYRV